MAKSNERTRTAALIAPSPSSIVLFVLNLLSTELSIFFLLFFHSFQVIYILYSSLVAKFILQFSFYLLFHLILILISCSFYYSRSFVPFFCSFFLSFIFLSLSGRDVGSILCLTSPFSCTQTSANKSRTGDL